MEKTETESLLSAAEAEAAAMGDMVRESLQGAAEAEAAAREVTKWVKPIFRT